MTLRKRWRILASTVLVIAIPLCAGPAEDISTSDRTLVLGGGVSLVLKAITPGTFIMGSPDTEAGHSDDERPLTRVTITKVFWLGQTEVTQAQWQAVMGSNPSKFVGADRPVETVSWNDAMAFCQKLTAQEQAAGRLPAGFRYTLPTEAQWEYSCRAGTTGPFAGPLDVMGWYSANSGEETKPVRQKQANAWGLYDMHGNVWEWCLDRYADRLPGGSVDDPQGAPSGSFRIRRGGSYSFSEGFCRSPGQRGGSGPNYLHNHNGFRLALSSIP
jgi:formylglycine-generating enzyme required for sulfatase activity